MCIYRHLRRRLLSWGKRRCPGTWSRVIIPTIKIFASIAPRLVQDRCTYYRICLQ